MNKLYRILTLILIVTIITAAVINAYAGVDGNENGGQPAASPNYNPEVIPPYVKIQGKTYGDWGAQWFNWALSVPYLQNPILDLTGIYGSQNQEGPVWFLAGTFGTTPAERTITIPAGKFIFFPLVSTENDYPCPPDMHFEPGPGQSLEDFLTFVSASQINPWTGPDHTLSATVDGVELTHLLNYRGTSKLTTLTAYPDPYNLQLDPCLLAKEQSMVSDGYWIMLAPLQPGQHTIHFSAITQGFKLDVTYHVTISK